MRHNFKTKKYLEEFLLQQRQGGQAIVIAVLFFLMGSFIIVSGITAPVLRDIQQARVLELSKKSFYFSESGIEDVSHRIKTGLPVSSTEELIFDNGSALTAVVSVGNNKEITSVGDKKEYIRKSFAVIRKGNKISFPYVVHAGRGGLIMKDKSEIFGDVYSNEGSIIAKKSNKIKGDAVSSGVYGLIDGVSIKNTGGIEGPLILSDAYAGTIRDSTIGGDAYYQTISNTTVNGTEYSGSANQSSRPFPISDVDIEKWKKTAEDGGTITSPCKIKEGTTSLGPIKIECDQFKIEDDATIELGGPVWIEGKLRIEENSVIRINPTLGNTSVPIITDDGDNSDDGSIIEIEKSVQFFGTGSEQSYVLVISQNTDAEDGGNESAIEVQDKVKGRLLVYATHGKVLVKNKAEIKGVVGYKVRLEDNATVNYTNSLRDLTFSFGGGFVIEDWLEVE